MKKMVLEVSRLTLGCVLDVLVFVFWVCVLGLCSYVFMFSKYSNLNSSVFRFLIMFFFFFG